MSDERDSRKLKLALSIISGRNSALDLCDQEWQLMGYDPYRFSEGCSLPLTPEAREWAEEYIAERIQSATE